MVVLTTSCDFGALAGGNECVFFSAVLNQSPFFFFFLHCLKELNLCYSKWSPCTNSICLIWELVRNAESWVQWTYWLQICILIGAIHRLCIHSVREKQVQKAADPFFPKPHLWACVVSVHFSWWTATLLSNLIHGN